jgi:DNA-binding response OmpR family regulator
MFRAADQLSRAPAGVGVPVGGVRLSVLVVTDDGALAGMCRSTLEQAGYEVTYASHSGHALLECLKGRRADMLLTELSLPDGLGPDLAKRLRRYFPDMQAVYFAGPAGARPEDMRPEGRAHDPGSLVDARNVLLRPFSGNELLACMSGLLTSGPAS